MAKSTRKPAKSKGKRKISIPTRIMLFVNVFFVFLLICSLLSSIISPVTFWPLAFAGIAYPFILIVNLFFVLFWVVFLKKYFILSLVTIAIGYTQFNSWVQFHSSSENIIHEDVLKVMSYNVRLFDLFNWINSNQETKLRTDIFSELQKEAPDVLCIQEYYNGKKRSLNYADTIKGLCHFNYYSDAYIDNGRKVLPFGLATFSKYPIISNQKYTFKQGYENFCVITDIVKGRDTLRILNTHLESVRFGKEDYVFVNELAKNSGKNNDITQGSKVIFSKMKKAFQKRAVQVMELAEIIHSSPYRVILCADFNDTPASYAYRQIAKIQKDAFTEAGSGLGQTYAGFIPILRIDYIFVDQTMSVLDYKTIHRNLSDHYPIVATIKLH